MLEYQLYSLPFRTFSSFSFFFFNDTATTEIYTLSLHDALPIYPGDERVERRIVELRRRDDDALPVECARIRGHRPRLRSADIGVVGARDGEADLSPRHERDVRQMRATRVRVVEDPHIVAPGLVPH